MRIRLLLLVLPLTGCGFCSPPPPKRDVIPVQKVQGTNRLQAVRPQGLRVVFPIVDAGTAAPTAPSAQQLDNYVGFSSDGLAFAYGQVREGLHALQIASSTTNTVERMILLDNDAHRAEALKTLKDDGFPGADETPSIPKELAVTVDGPTVRLTFSGLPVGAVKASPTTTKAEVAAVSADGKRAAVRITSEAAGQPVVEFHVFPVFP